jgi:hypothetical protein
MIVVIHRSMKKDYIGVVSVPLSRSCKADDHRSSAEDGSLPDASLIFYNIRTGKSGPGWLDQFRASI